MSNMHDVLLLGSPAVVGEILRAVAWPAQFPPHCYASTHDLRKDTAAVLPERAHELWTLALDYRERWRLRDSSGKAEADAVVREAVSDGRVGHFPAWGWAITVGVWWDGDGTIVFVLRDADEDLPPGDGLIRRVIVNHDSKKVHQWKEIA